MDIQIHRTTGQTQPHRTACGAASEIRGNNPESQTPSWFAAYHRCLLCGGFSCGVEVAALSARCGISAPALWKPAK